MNDKLMLGIFQVFFPTHPLTEVKSTGTEEFPTLSCSNFDKSAKAYVSVFGNPVQVWVGVKFDTCERVIIETSLDNLQAICKLF